MNDWAASFIALWVALIFTTTYAHRPGEHAIHILHSKIPFHAIQVGHKDFEGELYEVCQKGLVAANITTNTFRSVHIELMPLVPYPIEVSINPGSVLESRYSVYQPLVIAERKIMRLSATNQTVILATHSLTFQKRIPVGQLIVTPLMMPYHGITDGPDKPVVSQTQLWHQTSGGGRKIQIQTHLKRLKGKHSELLNGITVTATSSPLLWGLLVALCLLCTPESPTMFFSSTPHKDRKRTGAHKKSGVGGGTSSSSSAHHHGTGTKDKDGNSSNDDGHSTQASFSSIMNAVLTADKGLLVIICVLVVQNFCSDPIFLSLCVIYTAANLTTEGGLLLLVPIIPIAILLCLAPWWKPLPKWLFYIVPQFVAGGCALHAIGPQERLITSGVVAILLVLLFKLPSAIATFIAIPISVLHWIGVIKQVPYVGVDALCGLLHVIIYPLLGAFLGTVVLGTKWIGHVSVLDAFSVDPFKVTDVLGEATIQQLQTQFIYLYSGCLVVGSVAVAVRVLGGKGNSPNLEKKNN